MPICKKCDSSFPNRIVIDGKKRTLNNRKYCLECSPFGFKNTKKIHVSDTGLICETCGKGFDYKRGSSSHSTCTSCRSTLQRHAKKQKAVDYKGGKCEACSYNRCLRAMDFHHLDPEQKDFGIAGNPCSSWERMNKELDKCVLLCNRCHTEVHDDLLKL